MKRKTALAMVFLLMIFTAILTVSFTMRTFAQGGCVPTTPPDAEQHRFTTMGGLSASTTHLVDIVPRPSYWTVPCASRAGVFGPGPMSLSTNFSDPDPATGVVNLTIPHETFVGLVHAFYDISTSRYYLINVTLGEDGYGWLFTGNATDPDWNATNPSYKYPDIDVITFANFTGVFFYGDDDLAGTADDIFAGPPPNTGQDCIPGSGDDGFGDGTPDPPGSAVLYLDLTMDCDWWTGSVWSDLYEAPFTEVLTTATANCTVIEPDLLRGTMIESINGVNMTLTGHPYEKLNSGVSWEDPERDIWVEFVCCWSQLAVSTSLGPLDMLYVVRTFSVREDHVLLSDINRSYKNDYKDQDLGAKMYGAKDEGYPINNPTTLFADERYWPQGDFDASGKIDYKDMDLLAKQYGKSVETLKPFTWPTASFTYPSPIYNCTTTTFDASASSGNIILYNMVFFNITATTGNRPVMGTAGEQDPLVTTQVWARNPFGIWEGPFSCFPEPGTYKVYLHVTTEDGLSGTKMADVVVMQAP